MRIRRQSPDTGEVHSAPVTPVINIDSSLDVPTQLNPSIYHSPSDARISRFRLLKKNASSIDLSFSSSQHVHQESYTSQPTHRATTIYNSPTDKKILRARVHAHAIYHSPTDRRIQSSQHAHSTSATPPSAGRPLPVPAHLPTNLSTHFVDFSRFPDPYSSSYPQISPPIEPTVVVSKMPVPCGLEVVEPKVLSSRPGGVGPVVTKSLCPSTPGHPSFSATLPDSQDLSSTASTPAAHTPPFQLGVAGEPRSGASPYLRQPKGNEPSLGTSLYSNITANNPHNRLNKARGIRSTEAMERRRAIRSERRRHNRTLKRAHKSGAQFRPFGAQAPPPPITNNSIMTHEFYIATLNLRGAKQAGKREAIQNR